MNDNVRPLRFSPNGDRQRNIDSITRWFAGLGDGARVSWLEVEQKTGVKMTPAGRNLVRLVAKRLHRPYRSMPGLGFETSSADNGLDIVAIKTSRAIHAISVTKRTTDTVAARHLDQMTQEARNRLLQTQATFATLQLTASLAKKLPETT